MWAANISSLVLVGATTEDKVAKAPVRTAAAASNQLGAWYLGGEMQEYYMR